MNKHVHKFPSIFKIKQGSVLWQKVVTKGSVQVFKNFQHTQLRYSVGLFLMNLLLKSVAKFQHISVQKNSRLCVQLEMHTL